MTNAESVRSYFKETGDVEPSDFEWLIKQAERVNELEKDLAAENELRHKTERDLRYITDIHNTSEKENERLRGVLKEVYEVAKHDNQSIYLDKCYVIARQALKDVE